METTVTKLFCKIGIEFLEILTFHLFLCFYLMHFLNLEAECGDFCGIGYAILLRLEAMNNMVILHEKRQEIKERSRQV